MIQWEYMIDNVKGGIDVLNKYGEAGWEAYHIINRISCIPDGYDFDLTVFFKRKLP